MIKRDLQETLIESLNTFPAVALLGPRQVGKTTLSMALAEFMPSVYLDLESPADLHKLSDPMAYFQLHEDKLVILDEVQRMPNLFQMIRGLIDEGRRKGLKTARFLFLGSASIELIKQSSESLAGRIAYLELGSLSVSEVGYDAMNPLWLRGGFPDSFLAGSDQASLVWRDNFIRTYLERDIPSLGPRIPAETLRRFWTMLAHHQGALLNAASLARSLAVDGKTVTRYLDLLQDLLLVRKLHPWHSNAGKRLTKSPKVYVRDSGILHALLGIPDFEALLSNPIAGMSWEGFVVETILNHLPTQVQAHYYRTGAGAEIDLLLSFPDELWAVEIKRSTTPKIEKGFHVACDDLSPARRIVIHPGQDSYPLPKGIESMGIVEFLGQLLLG